MTFHPPDLAMAQGLVHTYNIRRGTGTVALRPSAAPIPFSARHADDRTFSPGERVEYRVVGGKAGVRAQGVRRIA